MGSHNSGEHLAANPIAPGLFRTSGKKDTAIRSFAEADIPQVVDLFWRYMRQREGSAPADLRQVFRKLYFENPWVDSAYPSLVYEEKSGEVIGFLGIVPRKMSMCGQPVRVGFGGNFIVQPGRRSQLAGPRLLGTYLGANYDVWQTDSANETSRKLLERLGFHTIPALNLHWIRPLRPSQYALYLMARGRKGAMASLLNATSKPFCALGDALASRLPGSPFRRREPRLRGSELDVETLLQCLTEFRQAYSFWAEYDVASLKWLLSFMDRGTARGRLRKIVVRDKSDRVVGWYIYYVKPGSIGEVVQVGGDKKFARDILHHFFHDAWLQGVVGLHGVLDRRWMADFSDMGCIFTCRGGWNVAFSRNSTLLDLLERGDAFLTRLDGEWCLDPGD
jgi:acetyltransferase (GNAT) family protein